MACIDLNERIQSASGDVQWVVVLGLGTGFPPKTDRVTQGLWFGRRLHVSSLCPQSLVSVPKVLCLSRMLDPVVSSFSVFFQVDSLCSYRFPWAPVCSPGQVPVGSKPITFHRYNHETQSLLPTFFGVR